MNLIKLSLERPKFIFMLTMFFVVIGAISLQRLPVDLYPDVSYPVIMVRANLSGAAPEEIEQLITKPMEDTLSSLSGLNTIRSTSREGGSFVILEFNADVDIKFQEMQVRAKVANIRRSLPDDMSEPVVARQDPDDTPIIEMAVTGNRTASELTRLVDDVIAERIRQLPGVGEVDLGGERTEEVHVELRPEALEAWRLSTAQVVQAIRNFNSNEPIGKLRGEGRVWLLRSPSMLRGVTDLGAIPVIQTTDGSPIFLRDLADIKLAFAEVQRVSSFNDGTGMRPAINLDVRKQSGENTVAVSDDVQKLLEQLRSELPSDIKIHVTRDNADLVRTNVADVVETLIIGALLTIGVVLLFLRSPRATVTTGISIPTSIIATFAIMAVAGFSINVMTLLGLSLAIGLLVDDAIVVRENIFRHLQKDSVNPKEAAYNGTRQVSLAVVATTLTIVAVFLPVGFMGGTVGQFFSQFAVTVVFAMSISLWDALTMAPMLSAYYANIPDPAKEWQSFGRVGAWIYRGLNRFEHSFAYLEKLYGRSLAWLLPRPWAAIGTALAALAIAYWGFSAISKSFLPAQLGQVFSASLTGPLAIPINQVTAVGEQVDGRIRNVEGIQSWSMRAGSGWSGNANINLTLRVKDSHTRNQSSLAKVRADVRSALQGFVGYSVRISEPADPLAGSSGRFQPIAVLVSGDDIGVLRDIARQVETIMNEIPGMADVMAPQDEGLPELELRTSPDFAGHFGVTSRNVSEELRNWIEGDTSNNLQLGNNRIPIRVRMADGDKMTASTLLAKSIFTTASRNQGSLAVPVGSAAHLEAGAGPSVIARENRQKILRIGANTASGAALGDIVNALKGELTQLSLPDGYRYRIVGQSEQMGELFSSVTTALLLGCLFMYMILASLFESFTQPITVMAAVPLAATGAVLALLLLDMPLDMYGGIGMILLAGIVAKNSILLVDFAVQKVRDEGKEPMTAILESAPLRLRPIIMTSIAMIAGMLPVATGLGVGGAARQALGVATIGGIISSTVLTLIIVPNLYVTVERLFRGRARHPST